MLPEYDFSLFKFWLLPNRRLGRPRLPDELKRPKYIKTGKPRGFTPNPALDDRAIEFKSLYENGKTLKEIGNQFFISRERVRQVLNKKFGITRLDGGKSTQMIFKIRDKLEVKKYQNEQKDRKSLKTFGCSREFLDLYGDWKKGSLAMAFLNQKRSAKNRSIKWFLSFHEWIDIWHESGKIDERGKGSGKYVMSRICDLGPYSKDNINIITHNENSKESRAMDKVRKQQRIQQICSPK